MSVFPILAAVLTERSETAATGSFRGISGRIATVRLTIGPEQSSLTRRSHSVNRFSIYTFLRFNISHRQLQCEIGITYKTIHRHVEHFGEALDTPSFDLRGPVEIDVLYASAGLARLGPETYEQDKPPSSSSWIAAASSDTSCQQNPQTNRRSGSCWLTARKSSTVYTDGFRAYDPLEKDDQFDREYVFHRR